MAGPVLSCHICIQEPSNKFKGGCKESVQPKVCVVQMFVGAGWTIFDAHWMLFWLKELEKQKLFHDSRIGALTWQSLVIISTCSQHAKAQRA